MFTHLCYLTATVIWAIAALTPAAPGGPGLDRARMACTGLAVYGIPAIAHNG